VWHSRTLPRDRLRAVDELLDVGFVHLEGRFHSTELAWSCARAICTDATPRDVVGADMPPLDVVGEFIVPPRGAPRRDFQALHLDFGLPIAPSARTDLTRFTALYVDSAHARASASTRIVPLRRLLGQRSWEPPERLIERFRTYAHRGAGESAVEGILGRLIEAADGSASLPPPSVDFLCGMEFSSIAEERAHFGRRGLDLAAAERLVRLAPGELLVFDNVLTAHGRVGVREPLELHQLCFGYPQLEVSDQAALLRQVLAAFCGPAHAARPATTDLERTRVREY
jgi:hypothetical protein